MNASLSLLGLGQRKIYILDVAAGSYSVRGGGDALHLKPEEMSANSVIQERLAARAAKNWAESDRIRDELAARGIALKDNKDGTTSWEVER